MSWKLDRTELGLLGFLGVVFIAISTVVFLVMLFGCVVFDKLKTKPTEEKAPPIKQAAAPATIEKPPPDEEENYEAADPQYYVVYPIKGYSKIMLFCDGYTGHKYIVTKWGGIARLEPVEWEVNR